MPYPSTNTNPSEIKLFYQIYGEKNSKPHDAILFNPDTDQKFGQDVIDDFVAKGLWDENLEQQLENKQLYFKVFREDEDMIPADAVMFENVRLLPNQGLLGLEESLQNKISNSFSWLGSFIPQSVKQTAFGFGNSLAQWTEDKLSGFSAYSGIPTVKEMDKEVWHEILDESSDESARLVSAECFSLAPSPYKGEGWEGGDQKNICKLLFTPSLPSPLQGEGNKKPNTELLGFAKDCSAQPTRDEKNETDPTSKSFAESFFSTAWSFAHYGYNNPLKTFTLALAAFSVANNFHLPKIKFENYSSPLTDGFSTATGVLTKLAVAQVATRGQMNTPLNTMITGMSLWQGAEATGPEFMVSTYTTYTQTSPKIAALIDGSFVVVWGSQCQGSLYLTDVCAQRFTTGVNATGIKIGTEFLANTYSTDSQSSPSITSLVDGSFIITWNSYNQDGNLDGIYAQRFTAIGTTPVKSGAEFRVNTYTINQQITPAIASLQDAGFVATWTSTQDGSGYGIYAQRFNTTGTKVGTEFQVNTYTTSDQTNPAIVCLSDGNFVVTWQSSGQGESVSYSNIYAQLFNGTSGTKLGVEFQVNTYTANIQSYPSIVGLTNGSFVVTWSSDGQDGSNYGIYGQRFNSTGWKLGLEFQMNSYTTNSQGSSTIANLSDGNFVVTWHSNLQDGDNYGIYGQRFDATGSKLSTEFLVNPYTTGFQAYPYVVGLQDGNFVVAWTSSTSGYEIRARVFTPPRLINNTLIIRGGETQILSNSVLGATATNMSSSVLLLTVSNVTHGRFEFVTTPGIPIFNFSQQQITNGQIQFAHDASPFAPNYYVKVSEVVLDTITIPGNIIFNTSPVLTNIGTSITFTEKNIPLIIAPNISLSDFDSPNMANATVAISNNFTSGEDVLGFVDQAGIAGNYNLATGQLFLMGSSSKGNYQLALRNVTYFNPSANPSLLPRTISFTVNDGVLNSNTITQLINIVPVNDPPVLLGSGGSILFVEKDLPLVIDSNITVTDVDNSNLVNATVVIAANFAGSEDVLAFVAQGGISGNYNTGTGVLSLTGISTISNYQAILRSVTYRDTSSNPSVLPRTITFTVSDGALIGSTTRTINIISINDAPTLTDSGGTLSFIEKNPATIIDPGIIVFDIDSPNLTNATVKFTSSVLREDVLGFTTQGGISGAYSNTTGILFLTGSASVANYQSALRSVTYANPSLNPSAAVRTVAFTVNDGQLDSNTVNRVISVAPVNDPPILAVNTITISGGQSFNLTSAQLYATDPDSLENSLAFTISGIQFCRFERTTAAGVSITTFIQQDIANNQIRIVPTGGTISAPAYQVSVSDGQYSTAPASASVNFNGGFVPSISVNKLTITQGGVVILTTNQLNAFDADTPASSLTFTASNIRYGTFSIVSNPANPITTFTLQSLSNGFIQFAQDGSENSPSYDISVSDGTHATNTQAAMITYININQAPIVLSPIPNRFEKVNQAFSFQIAPNTFFDSDPGDQQLLVYSAKMQNGNVLPTWIIFDSANRQFSGTPLIIGQTPVSVIAKDPSNAVGVANFTIDVSAVSAVQSPIANTPNDTIRNALIAAGVSGFVGLGFFALKYGIKRAVNKKLQTALEASKTDAEKKQQEYDKEVINPIATYVNTHLKVTAPFESISTEKVKNFIGAVRILVSELGGLGIFYQNLNQDDRNIVHTTIVRELKRIAHPADEDCCSALLRCGFFKADITSEQIEANAEKIAKAVNKALNRAQLNAAVRSSDPKNPRGLVAQSVELTSIPESSESAPSKSQTPRVSTILPKLEAEKAARQQLEGEMAEMKKQMALLLSAQFAAPVTSSESQQTSTPPSLSM
jgi:hypothetical protein